MSSFIVCLVNEGEQHLTHVESEYTYNAEDHIVFHNGEAWNEYDQSDIVAVFSLWAWWGKADAIEP